MQVLSKIENELHNCSKFPFRIYFVLFDKDCFRLNGEGMQYLNSI